MKVFLLNFQKKKGFEKDNGYCFHTHSCSSPFKALITAARYRFRITFKTLDPVERCRVLYKNRPHSFRKGLSHPAFALKSNEVQLCYITAFFYV